MRKVRVKGLPAAIPAHLDVDVSELDVNQSIHIRDLKLKGLTPLERPDAVVAAVKVPKKVEEAAPAAAPAATPAAAAKTAEAKPAAAKK